MYGRYSKYRSAAKVYNTRLHKWMENEERAHLEAYCKKKKLGDVKNNMARMASLLEQLLRTKFGEGTSSQQLTILQPPIALVIPDSQNLGANTATKPQGTTSIPMAHLITPAQVSAIIDLTMEEPYEVKPSDHSNQDKWSTLEERLKVVEGSDFYDLIRATKICSVSNVIMSKKFRVPKFVK
jgi:hypothetical protein